TRPYPTSGVWTCPCSDVTSFSRAVPAGASSCAATGTAVSITSTNVIGIRIIDSEDLVQDAYQPSRGKVVLDQAAAEVADPHLSDRRRRHDVARPDVGRAHDAGEYQDLPVAVDVDLA